jgi:transposase-like protein
MALLRWLWPPCSSETVGMRPRRSRSPQVPRSAFVGFRFPPDVIVLAVRWYLRFGLSYRDVEELLAERGIEVDHVTIHRWGLRFTSLLAGHRTDQYANNAIECDHGRLKARLRPMRGLKHDRSTKVIIAGHAFVQNVRRGHYELAPEEPATRRLAVAFEELALVI